MNTTAKKLATRNVSPWVNNVLKIVLPQTNRRQPPQRAALLFSLISREPNAARRRSAKAGVQ
jgi:hypothetical protein